MSIRKFDRTRLSALTVLGAVMAVGAGAQEKLTYQDHIMPLVEANCSKCHNPDKKKGDLDLTSYSGLMKGGGSGVIVVSGNPDSSKMYRAITHAEEPEMPPNKPKLPDKELDLVKKWIAGGLLETSGSKAIAAARPTLDLTLKSVAIGKPDGPPPMPQSLSLEPFFHAPRPGVITGLAASPWAPVVALSGQKQVLLYHTGTLELLGILPFPEGYANDLKFSRNAKLLLAGGGHSSKSGRVVVWDVTSGERLTTLGEEYDSVLGADLSPDQSKIALGSPSRLVKIYSTSTGELLHKMKKHTDWVTAVAFSPNGEWLASADRNGGVTVWDADNGQELYTTAGHKSAITGLSWREDSKVLASVSEDGSLKLWEAQEGKPAKNWTAHGPGVLSVNFAHDGRLVTCGRDNVVASWDGDGNKLHSFEFNNQIPVRATFSHDGARVIATDFAGNVAVWSAANGKRAGTLDANPPMLAEQIELTEKRIKELQSGGAKTPPGLTEARAELSQAETEAEKAAAALKKAEADKLAKEAGTAKLKAALAQTPTAELTNQVAAARAIRNEARVAFTNATTVFDTANRRLSAIKSKLAGPDTFDAAAELSAARTQLARLKEAQAQTAYFRAKEAVAARKRERDNLLAVIKANQEAAQKAADELASATDKAAKEKLKEQIKTCTAEAKKAETAAKKLEKELASEQARLDKLTVERGKASATDAVKQSKL